jgi:flagellar FliL protein
MAVEAKPVAAPAAAGAAAGGTGRAARPAMSALGRKRTQLLLFGAIGVVALAVLATAGWFLAPRLLGWPRSPHAAVKPEPPVKATVPLGAVVVNIGAPDKRRYLKVAVELGVPGAKESKEVEHRKPQITDLLITVLSTAPVESLGTEDGRVAIKKALITRIKDELALDTVSRVYFTEFVIQ